MGVEVGVCNTLQPPQPKGSIVRVPSSHPNSVRAPRIIHQWDHSCSLPGLRLHGASGSALPPAEHALASHGHRQRLHLPLGGQPD